MALPITVYGSRTCEDTQITLDRLRALGLPFTEYNREDGPETEAALRRYNKGQVRTPTVVWGDDQIIQVEPAMEALEAAAKEAGYTPTVPGAVEFTRPLSDAPAPGFELPSSRGERLALFALRGRRRAVLFFAHDPACRVCQGYARQLAAQQRALEELDGRPVFVLPADLEAARHWGEEFAPGVEVLADADGAVKRLYAREFAEALHSTAEGVMLLLLDRYTAPRAGSYATDAGGLISPAEARAWLGLLDCECSE